MAVTVNSERKAVEIAWEPLGGNTQPDPPEGFPEHPIFIPPTPEHPIVLPPADSIWPDEGKPEHPIYIPPWLGLFPEHPIAPGGGPRPEHPISPGGEEPTHPIEPGGRPTHPIAPGGEGEGEGHYPSHPIRLPDYEPPSGGNVPTPQGGKQIAVQIFAEGQEGDWSNTAVMPNDGLGVLTYPKDFTGESYVEVRSLDGAVIDSGTITVK